MAKVALSKISPAKGTETSAFGTVSRSGHDSSPFYSKKIYTSEDGMSSILKEEATSNSKTKEKEAKSRNLGKDAGKKKLANQQITKDKVNQNNKGSDPDTLPEFPTNIIYCDDACNMKHIPDNSLALMITSPPYNVGKEYDDDLSLAEYSEMLKGVFTDTYRVLCEGGRACINIANIGRKPYLPLHMLVIKIMSEIGFLMRGEIIWDKGASAGGSCAWGSWKSASNPVLRDVHEYILVYSKGSYSRPFKKTSTIQDREFLDYTKSIWNFNATSARKAGHPAPFPVELPRRLIELYSFKDDVILDPFIGSGSTAVAALRSDRKYIGYDISADYVKLAESRIAQDRLDFIIEKEKESMNLPLQVHDKGDPDRSIKDLEAGEHQERKLANIQEHKLANIQERKLASIKAKKSPRKNPVKK